MEPTRERELWSESITRRKYSGPQLSGMSLHLVPVLVYASEEICTTMDIQHNSGPLVAFLFPSIVIASHLNPLGLELATLSSPLPPLASPNLIDAFMA